MPYDLAIVDYQMPGMDGAEVARHVKADPAVAGTSLVMLTSVGERGESGRMRDLGYAGYLVKPIKQTKLRDMIRTIWAARTNGVDIGFVTQDSHARREQGNAVVESESAATRVLVVEDNPMNQKVASRTLERLGCRVDIAANGLEAVDMVNRFPYDVIFMDCQMPEMDGYEATRRIRQLPGVNAHIPIIAITANAFRGDREACLASGMDDYLTKPVGKAQFDQMLAKWNPLVTVGG
jgi:CheY-like chemotaxis protein